MTFGMNNTNVYIKPSNAVNITSSMLNITASTAISSSTNNMGVYGPRSLVVEGIISSSMGIRLKDEGINESLGNQIGWGSVNVIGNVMAYAALAYRKKTFSFGTHLQDSDGLDSVLFISGAKTVIGAHANDTNPTETLHVIGSVSASDGFITGKKAGTYVSASADGNFEISGSGTAMLTVDGHISASGKFYPHSNTLEIDGNISSSGDIYLRAGNSIYLNHPEASADIRILYTTGNGILLDSAEGILIPTTGNATNELTVYGNISASGTIYASQFNDDGTNLNVPDYVFETGYVLQPLSDVEEHISESKHLPNIPSMDDINSWSKLSYSDRDMKLLEKIEELTLYIIDLQKQVNELKNK